MLLALLTLNNWPSLEAVGQFFYILLAVAFVALLAYYSTKLLASAKLGRGRGGRRNLEIVENIGVGAQSMAQLIRAGRKYFLIGVTKERISLLAELDESCLDLPEPSEASPSFENILRKFQNKRQDDAAEDEARNE